MDLSGGIRFHRQRHGLTLDELAALSGVDAALLARYEAGEQQPNIPNAGAIAAVLQVSMLRLAEAVATALDVDVDMEPTAAAADPAAAPVG